MTIKSDPIDPESLNRFDAGHRLHYILGEKGDPDFIDAEVEVLESLSSPRVGGVVVRFIRIGELATS